MKSQQRILTILKQYIVDDGLSPEEATEKALESADKQELIELCTPPILDRAYAIQRNITRTAERRIFNGGSPSTSVSAASVTKTTPRTPGRPKIIPSRHQAIQTLITSTFPGDGGRPVLWPDATVADHEWRAKWQRSHAASSVMDAENHEKTMARISSFPGATCLRDTPDWQDWLAAL